MKKDREAHPVSRMTAAKKENIRLRLPKKSFKIRFLLQAENESLQFMR